MRRKAERSAGKKPGSPEVVQVVGVYGKSAEVEVGGVRRVAALRGRLKQGRRRTTAVLAPGDLVRLASDDAGDELAIDEILPRRNRISRTAAGGRYEQVLYVNVELLVVVGSVREPVLAPGLFDRFLVAAEREQIDAAIVVNKSDLGVSARDREILAIYADIGYPIVMASAEKGEGIEEARALCRPGLTVFAGHSGVGKSSLLNLILPGFDQSVADVSTSTGRGRHTTTKTSLRPLSPGVYVADTPGVREFALHDFKPDEVGFGFREFVRFISDCRFKGCTHSSEPRCAVRAACDRGEISKLRYESYVRMVQEHMG